MTVTCICEAYCDMSAEIVARLSSEFSVLISHLPVAHFNSTLKQLVSGGNHRTSDSRLPSDQGIMSAYLCCVLLLLSYSLTLFEYHPPSCCVTCMHATKYHAAAAADTDGVEGPRREDILEAVERFKAKYGK